MSPLAFVWFRLGPGQSWMLLLGVVVPWLLVTAFALFATWVEHEGAKDVAEWAGPIVGVLAAVALVGTVFVGGQALDGTATYRTVTGAYRDLRADPLAARIVSVDVHDDGDYGDARVEFVDRRGRSCAGWASYVAGHWYLHHKGKAKPSCYMRPTG